MPVFKKCRNPFRRGRYQDAPPADYESDDEEVEDATEDQTKEEIVPPTRYEENMPSYFHVGGSAKECLIRGYNIGPWRFDCSTSPRENSALYSYGQAKPTSTDIAGGVGMRQLYGPLNVCQAWKIDEYLAMIGFDFSTDKTMGYSRLKGTYMKQGEGGFKIEAKTGIEYNPIKCEVIIPVWKAPKFMGYALLQMENNYLFGYRTVFDVGRMAFDKHAFTAGYSSGITELSIKLENFVNVRGSIFQRVGDRWAFALKAFLYGEDAKKFAIGGQYQLNKNLLIKARLRDDGTLGFVHQHRLSPYIEIMYHCSVQLQSPIRGTHNIGIGITLIDF